MRQEDQRPPEKVAAIKVITYRPGQIPADRLEETAALRWKAWKPLIKGDPRSRRNGATNWLEPADHAGLHFTIMDLEDPTKIAAAARLSFHDRIEESPEPFIPDVVPDWPETGPAALLAHVVVDLQDRHHSFGYRIDTLAMDTARAAAIQLIGVLAVLWRVANYRRHGYDMYGSVPVDIHGYLDKDFFVMARKP